MQGFQQPITIKAALDGIQRRDYLLPAIQRRFVWSHEQIEALFDSLMRGYPINSFMFWKITDQDVKSSVRFYDFLQSYRERYKERNAEFVTRGHGDFFAVIDGQQRLTALYVGLLGTYAYKRPRVWWWDSEDAVPTRRLHLNLDAERPDDDELAMKYDFRFLTEADATKRGDGWFPVGKILDFPDQEDLDAYLDAGGRTNADARRALRKLWRVVHHDPTIHYYVETNQSIDVVVDIFIRTNSGGEPLSYSDLLMSYTTAQWRERDARAVFDNLIERVFQVGHHGFIINKDFILKTCLVLFSSDVRFRLKHLNTDVIGELEKNWNRVAACILAAFEFLADIGFHELNLRSKFMVIPIVQYLYLREIEGNFNKPQLFTEDKAAIRTWLCMSVLKGVFRAQTDHLLRGLRAVIRDAVATGETTFPLEAIRDRFRGNPARSLTFDQDFLDEMLRTELDRRTEFALLTLLYSHLDYSRQKIDIDHLHPSAIIGRIRALPESERMGDWEYIVDPTNWNSVANLQPLHESLNRSKQDQPLAEWVEEHNIDRQTHLLPTDADLDIASFRTFIERRRGILSAKLRTMLLA